MTTEQFIKTVSEINAQWIAIKTNAANMEISGNKELKANYIESVRPNIDVLHATLTDSLAKLTQPQRMEIGFLKTTAKKLSEDLFKFCTNQYIKNVIEAKEERKNGLNRLEDSKNAPLSV